MPCGTRVFHNRHTDLSDEISVNDVFIQPRLKVILRDSSSVSSLLILTAANRTSTGIDINVEATCQRMRHICLILSRLKRRDEARFDFSTNSK